MEAKKLKEILNLPKQEKLNLFKTLCKNMIEEHQNDLSEEQIKIIEQRLLKAQTFLSG